MLATLIAITTLGLPGQDSKATAILTDMLAALKKIRTVELTVESRPDQVAKALPYTARVRLSREPRRYWAKVERSEQEPEEYCALVGTKLTYTEEGKRVQREVPFWNVIVNNASDAGRFAWQIFCEWERYERGLKDTHYYVMEDEIEGRVCDMIGIVGSRLVGDSKEKMFNIGYLWVDRETHLPKAYQSHLLGRGRSAVLPKVVVTEMAVNPVLKDDAFSAIPESVAMPTKKPALPMSAPKGIQNGASCPDLNVQTIDMKTVKLASLVKQDALVTFWAPWCGPCIAEMKALAELPEVKSGTLRVIAVGVQDSKQRIRAYAKENRLPFTLAIDLQCELKGSALTSAFGIESIPHAFLFKKGKLARSWIGFADKSSLIKKLKGN